jgi:hypothetical protein
VGSSKNRRRLEVKREKRAARNARRRSFDEMNRAAALPKMSDTLLEYARFVIENMSDVTNIHGLLSVASLCWNAAECDDAEQLVENKLAERIEIHAGIRGLISGLILRKRSRFAHDPRLIRSLSVVPNAAGDGVDVDVAYYIP